MFSLKALTTGSECPPLEKGVLRIYSNGICPYAQRTRMVLLHKNIPHEVINVALSKEKPEWYLKKNPFGTVPCLEQDDKLIPESIISCEYLDEVYPNNKLTASDPYQKAKDKFLLEKWSKVVSLVYAVYRTQGNDQTVVDNIRTNLDMVESELAERGTTFFGGESPMLIDFYIWPHMERLVIQKDLVSADMALSQDRYPKVLQWVDNITAVPAVKATQLSAEKHSDFFVSYATGTPNYDVALEE